MENKKCITCNQDFIPKQARSKYCSENCCQKYKYDNSKTHTKLCLGCGVEFSSYRNDLQYCSKSCSGSRAKGVLTIEKILTCIEENQQISAVEVRKKLNTSTRTIYSILKANGYNSYKELVGIVKGVYLEKLRSDTSNAAINCFEYIKTLVNSSYRTEVVFDKLINPKTKRALRVDCLFDDINLVVEYNGIQHYKNIPYFHKGENTLEYQKIKDNIKLQFFKNSDYRYIIIPYWFTVEDIYAVTIKSEAKDTSLERLETT